MIYMKWFIPCPACGKRGTFENKKKAILKTTLDGRETRETWLDFVCRHCGKVRKNMSGTWDDVGEEEWKIAQNNGLYNIQLLDEPRVKPVKKQKRKHRKSIGKYQ